MQKEKNVKKKSVKKDNKRCENAMVKKTSKPQFRYL